MCVFGGPRTWRTKYIERYNSLSREWRINMANKTNKAKNKPHMHCKAFTITRENKNFRSRMHEIKNI